MDQGVESRDAKISGSTTVLCVLQEWREFLEERETQIAPLHHLDANDDVFLFFKDQGE